MPYGPISNVRVACNGPSGNDALITVDGLPVMGVVEARWSAKAGELTRLVLVLEGAHIDALAGQLTGWELGNEPTDD